MESLAKLVSSIASIAWPLIFAVFLYALRAPIKTLIESARGRKFTIKVAGNELTMEEASEQQRKIVSDIQTKLAEVERQLITGASTTPVLEKTPGRSDKRILWVDDNPKNNSFFVASLEERGAQVEVAVSTEEGIKKFKAGHYDIVISDMARPEGEKAGIDLAKKIHTLNLQTPVFIFCGSWAARSLRDESLQAGVTEITSSGTTLLRLLPLTNAI